MKYIVHRTNTTQDLDRVSDLSWGCEIDLRSDLSQPNKLHLSHNAWERGEDFDSWLKTFKAKNISGTLILNTKEDGLEDAILERLKSHKIENYFFLDTALPTLVKWTQIKGIQNFAVRLSHYEPIEFVERFSGLASWVWVDCFHLRPLSHELLIKLKTKFKICLVSPELQGGTHEDFAKFRELANHSDAICTKKPQTWLDQLAI